MTCKLIFEYRIQYNFGNEFCIRCKHENEFYRIAVYFNTNQSNPEHSLIRGTEFLHVTPSGQAPDRCKLPAGRGGSGGVPTAQMATPSCADSWLTRRTTRTQSTTRRCWSCRRACPVSTSPRPGEQWRHRVSLVSVHPAVCFLCADLN